MTFWWLSGLGGAIGLLILWLVILWFGLFSISYISLADNDTHSLEASGHPLPRFVSLRSNKVNVRRGPGTEYPIVWQFQRRGLPLEIIAEYKLWRHIRDYEGAQGWIHASLLRGQRAVILKVTPKIQPLRSAPNKDARMLALLQAGVIAELEGCNQDWCEINLDHHDGWLPRDVLWGLYPFEFNKD